MGRRRCEKEDEMGILMWNMASGEGEGRKLIEWKTAINYGKGCFLGSQSPSILEKRLVAEGTTKRTKVNIWGPQWVTWDEKEWPNTTWDVLFEHQKKKQLGYERWEWWCYHFWRIRGVKGGGGKRGNNTTDIIIGWSLKLNPVTPMYPGKFSSSRIRLIISCNEKTGRGTNDNKIRKHFKNENLIGVVARTGSPPFFPLQFDTVKSRWGVVLQELLQRDMRGWEKERWKVQSFMERLIHASSKKTGGEQHDDEKMIVMMSCIISWRFGPWKLRQSTSCCLRFSSFFLSLLRTGPSLLLSLSLFLDSKSNSRRRIVMKKEMRGGRGAVGAKVNNRVG